MSAKHRIYRTPLKTLLCEALCSRPLGDFAWYPGFFNAYINGSHEKLTND